MTFLELSAFNPFIHIGDFWYLWSSWLYETIVAKEEIAHYEQFLLLPQCFQIYSILKILLSFLKIFHIFAYVYFKSRLLQICCMWERVFKVNMLSEWKHCDKRICFIGVLRRFQHFFSYITATVWQKMKLLIINNVFKPFHT